MELLGILFRRLPVFKGKLRLASMLGKLFLKPNEERVIRLKDGLVFKLPNLIENLSLELYANGIYERELVNYLIKNLPPKAHFIDVGANIGAISVFVAKKRPDISIYAFEASTSVAGYLRDNVLLNDLTNVQVINKAVYTEDGMTMDFYSPPEKFGKGSLAPVFTDKKESVKTVRLDTFCSENHFTPACVKIDVEGFEYFVIDSLEHCFRGNQLPVVIFEFVDWAERQSTAKFVGAAQARLMDAGYKIYDFSKFIQGRNHPIDSVLKTGSHELIGFHYS